jgi:glycosyltransferase involved in cell wall biosynthesis
VKRICFIVSTVETVRVFLSDHIEKLSDEFEVYLAGNLTIQDFSVLNKLKLSGYFVVPINRKINIFNDLKSIIKLANYLRHQKFHATHSVTPKAGLICAIASYMVMVPNRIHIFTGQIWSTKKGLFRWLLKNLDKLIVLLSTDILVDGEPQRQYLITNKVVTSKKSRVLGKGSISGVDPVKFSPNPVARDSIRIENQLDNKIVFGFLGRLNKDKGIFDLLQAFDKICSENSGVLLLLVGPDEENILSDLQKYINIKPGVNFIATGYTDQPQLYLRAFDVFCLPSYREGFGTSVIEAASTGIPAICSDAYGLLDTIVDKQTGLRHKVGDVNELYQLMLRMIDDEAFRISAGIAAREYVLKNFNSELITSAWIRFYKSLV